LTAESTVGRGEAPDDEVADASRRLIDELVTSAAPKNREVEAERARVRAAERWPTA